MKIIHVDYDEQKDFADEMIRAIENNYGCNVARIPHFSTTADPGIFDLKIIFTDFKLFEATVKVQNDQNSPSIQIHGNYY